MSHVMDGEFCWVGIVKIKNIITQKSNESIEEMQIFYGKKCGY